MEFAASESTHEAVAPNGDAKQRDGVERSSTKVSKRKPRDLRGSSFLKLHFLSSNSVAVTALLILCLLNFGGIFVFCRGFLLTRIALEDRNDCTGCTLAPRYNRTIVLVVDALRYDFVFPRTIDATEYSPYYHNIFDTPANLSNTKPDHSLLFKFVADPPTTTLQRIKGLTVGTLPTFVDAGSNFAGSRSAEDSWVEQAYRAGRKIAFVGDDTWLSVFPEHYFQMSYPHDSFNVEDLDTVDRGVEKRLLELLETDDGWDIAIGHMLGLDHVGHRVGTLHPEMTRKLTEADSLVRRILSLLREDDLFIVMGDHGMDAQGNHGGDSENEVEAALWLYSNTAFHPPDQPPPCDASHPLSSLFAPEDCFTLDGEHHRSIAQISLVPTLSLLLGLPIPFSNLGSIIPEIFLLDGLRSLSNAVDINVNQISLLLAKSPDLRPTALTPTATNLDDLGRIIEQLSFARGVLKSARALWATFDPIAILMGIAVLALACASTWKFFRLAQEDGCLWRSGKARLAVARGAIAYVSALTVTYPALAAWNALSSLDRELWFTLPLFVASIACSVGILSVSSRCSSRCSASTVAGLLIIALHSSLFASNSFVVWEEKMLTFVLQSALLVTLAYSLAIRDARSRRRTSALTSSALVAVRLMAISSACREEQHPFCEATFYPTRFTRFILALNLIIALILPELPKRMLRSTASLEAAAGPWLSIAFRALLFLGSLYWCFEWSASSMGLDGTAVVALVNLKNIAAQVVLCLSVAMSTFVWYQTSLCLSVTSVARGPTKGETHVVIMGHANAFGSSYLLLFASIFSYFWLLAQPVGQTVLALALAALLVMLEIRDGVRDSISSADQGSASLVETSLLAIFGYCLFYFTGHQATLPSIQWKVAFVGFETVTYPFSPALVVSNSFAAFILTSMAVPLLSFWKVSPAMKPHTQAMLRHLFSDSVAFIAYHSTVTLPSVIFAAHFRRHLMVWKVFAPRFMTAIATLVIVNAVVGLLAFAGGGLNVLGKVSRVYGTRWS